MDSPHKGPVMQKAFQCHEVSMKTDEAQVTARQIVTFCQLTRIKSQENKTKDEHNKLDKCA